MSTLKVLASTLEISEPSSTLSLYQTSAPSPFQSSVYEKDEKESTIKITSVPLTIVLKIFTRRLEKVYRNIHETNITSEGGKQRKVVKLPDFIRKANSACDMYQDLFQDDIKNSQGIVSDATLRNAKNKKLQIKQQMHGPLLEKSVGKKKETKGKEKEHLIGESRMKPEQILSKDEKDDFMNDIYKEKPISWADDVEEKFKSINELRDDEIKYQDEYSNDEKDLNDSETSDIEHVKDESGQDNVTVEKISPYLLKEHAKLIYEELEKEFDTRSKLYEMDKVPHVSAKPTGKMKKTGQKRRRYEHKLKRHERSLCDGGLMNRKRNVNKTLKVMNRWKIVLKGIENGTWSH
ncbi:3003_t:CDS:2 [Rhizophagus irregularis]|nr:3003_t:CDS:2 [Rhizophagus irregularis]